MVFILSVFVIIDILIVGEVVLVAVELCVVRKYGSWGVLIKIPEYNLYKCLNTIK